MDPDEFFSGYYTTGDLMVGSYSSETPHRTDTYSTRLPQNVAVTYHRSSYAVAKPPQYGPCPKRQKQTMPPPVYPGPGKGIHIAPPAGGAGSIFNRPRPSPYQLQAREQASHSFERMCKSFQEEEEESPLSPTPTPTPVCTPRRVIPQDHSPPDSPMEPYYHRSVDRDCSLEEAVLGEPRPKGKQEETYPSPHYPSPSEESGLSLEDEEAELERQKHALAQARARLEQGYSEGNTDQMFGAYHMDE